jgi:hypothetical protein
LEAPFASLLLSSRLFASSQHPQEQRGKKTTRTSIQMAYLHQPIALNPITYSSGAFINTDASPTLSNSTTSPQTQMLSVYNREYGKDRGQLPLALVSSVTGGADLSAFGYDDDETEDGSSIPTVRDDDDNDNDNEDSNGNRMMGNVPLNPVVDVVLSGDGGGDGYGANVRSVAAYYRMPIESPTLPTVPISAVANGSKFVPLSHHC